PLLIKGSGRILPMCALRSMRACAAADAFLLTAQARERCRAYDGRRVYYAKGDFDRVAADYDQAIQLDPRYVFAYNNRGNLYQNKGELDRAIADFSQAIEIQPNFAQALYARILAYQIKGEIDRAIAD